MNIRKVVFDRFLHVSVGMFFVLAISVQAQNLDPTNAEP